MLRKLHSKEGVTLTEMLVAVLLLSFLGLAMTSGLGVAMNIYKTSKEYAESRVLIDSAINAIADEMRYATDITVNPDDGSLFYQSKIYLDAEIKLDGKGQLVIQFDSDTDPYRPLGERAYVGLAICPKEENNSIFTYDGSDAISISFDIVHANALNAENEEERNIIASVSDVKIYLLNVTD